MADDELSPSDAYYSDLCPSCGKSGQLHRYHCHECQDAIDAMDDWLDGYGHTSSEGPKPEQPT